MVRFHHLLTVLLFSGLALPVAHAEPVPAQEAILHLDGLWTKFAADYRALGAETAADPDLKLTALPGLAGWWPSKEVESFLLDPKELDPTFEKSPRYNQINSAIELEWQSYIDGMKMQLDYNPALKTKYQAKIESLNSQLAEYRKYYNDNLLNPALKYWTTHERSTPTASTVPSTPIAAEPHENAAPVVEAKTEAKSSNETRASEVLPVVTPKNEVAQPKKEKIEDDEEEKIPSAARTMVAQKSSSDATPAVESTSNALQAKPAAEAVANTTEAKPEESKNEESVTLIEQKASADTHVETAPSVAANDVTAALPDSAIVNSPAPASTPAQTEKKIFENDLATQKSAQELSKLTANVIMEGVDSQGNKCALIFRDNGKMYFDNEKGIDVTVIKGSKTDAYAGLKTGEYANVSWGQNPAIGAGDQDIPADLTAKQLRETAECIRDPKAKCSDRKESLPLPTVRRQTSYGGEQFISVGRLGYKFVEDKAPHERQMGGTEKLDISKQTRADQKLVLKEIANDIVLGYQKDKSYPSGYGPLLDHVTISTWTAKKPLGRDDIVEKDIDGQGVRGFLKKEAYATWKNKLPEKKLTDRFSKESTLSCGKLKKKKDLPHTWVAQIERTQAPEAAPEVDSAEKHVSGALGNGSSKLNWSKDAPPM